jgi:small subunit ribosomal protein S18
MRRNNMARKHIKRKKSCFYCKNNMVPNYKMVDVIKNVTTDRGKILPRRMTGICAKHQRKLATAIKRARHLALLPFVSENIA